MSEPIKVLIADDMSKKAIDLLTGAGFSVDVKTGMKPEELAAVVGQYHGLGVRSASKVTAAGPVRTHFFSTVGTSVTRSFSMNTNGGMSSEALMPK